MTKTLVWYGEMLTDIRNGIYTRWNHYDDGSVEIEYIPKGPIFIIPTPFYA